MKTRLVIQYEVVRFFIAVFSRDQEYLSQRVELSTEQILQQLLKRLQITFHISQRNPESDLKLLELQQQLSGWLHSSKRTTNRVCVHTRK